MILSASTGFWFCCRKVLNKAAPTALVLGLVACAQQPGTDTAANTSSDVVGPNTLNVADAAIQSGDPYMALSITQSVLKDNPDNVDALVHEGNAYYALNRCLPAEAAYQTALKYDAKSSPAETGLGRCLLKSDPAAAEKAFLAAVAADPGNAAAWSDIGVARDLQGNFKGAVGPYQKSILINPGSTATVVDLGLSLAISGHGPEALQYLGPLATSQEATPKIREDYAVALIASGEDERARDILAVDLPPDQVQQAMDGFSALISNSIQQLPAPPPPRATQPIVATPPVSEAPVPPTTSAPAAAEADTVSAPHVVEAKTVPVPASVQHMAAVPLTTNTLEPKADTGPVVPYVADTGGAPVPVQQLAAPAARTSASGTVAVQLGALDSVDAAKVQWNQISAAAPSLFHDKSPDISEAVVKGKTYYRLRVDGFANQLDAARFCGEVSAAGDACTVADF